MLFYFLVCSQDLAQYVNEVKRDNETLREIDQYQKSIENLVSCLFFQNNKRLTTQLLNALGILDSNPSFFFSSSAESASE